MKVLLLLALVGLGYAVSDRELFSQIYNKYKEDDGLLRTESSSALKTRLQIFKKHKAEVELNNADDSTGWTATVDNQFSILSEAECNSHLGLNESMVMADRRRSARSAAWEEADLALSLELRAADVDYVDKLPAIKNQKSCGSCWAFGAMAALEYQVNRKKGSKIKNLSEQQFLDCTYEGSRDGCNGGWPTQAYAVAKAAGSNVASTAKIPYTAKDNACGSGYYKESNNGMKGYKIESYSYLSKGDAAMKIAVANDEIGVISVAIGVYSTFFSYSSGVWTDSSSCAGKNINHAVDVVGYGTEGGIDYWRVRNSWGSWGDAGYINMKRGSDICKIATYGHYPVVSGQDEGGDDDDDEKDDDEKDDDDKDDGCGACLKKCCDGRCLHEHMCPASCDDDDKDKEEVCEWQKTAEVKCQGKMGKMNMSLAAAKEACAEDEKCVCVTCKKKQSKKCGMKKKDTTMTAGAKWASYTCSADKIMK